MRLTTDDEIGRVVWVLGLSWFMSPLLPVRQMHTYHEPLVYLHRLVHRGSDGIFMDLLKRRQGQVLAKGRGHDLWCETLEVERCE